MDVEVHVESSLGVLYTVKVLGGSQKREVVWGGDGLNDFGIVWSSVVTCDTLPVDIVQMWVRRCRNCLGQLSY